MLEALVKCGAFDNLGANRAQLLDGLDLALDIASQQAREREMGQNFAVRNFGTDCIAAESQRFASAFERSDACLGKRDARDLCLGPSVGGSRRGAERSGTTSVRDLAECEDDTPCVVGGMLTDIRRTLTKAGQQMLFAKLEDTSGAIELVVFPKTYPVLQVLFQDDGVVIVRVRVRTRERRGGGEESIVERSIQVNEVTPFATAPIIKRLPAGILRCNAVNKSMHWLI